MNGLSLKACRQLWSFWTQTHEWSFKQNLEKNGIKPQAEFGEKNGIKPQTEFGKKWIWSDAKQ